MKTKYHIFTNGRDEWTDHYDEAKAIFIEFGEEYGCARLYRDVYENEAAYENDEMLSEECLDSTGEYPA